MASTKRSAKSVKTPNQKPLPAAPPARAEIGFDDFVTQAVESLVREAALTAEAGIAFIRALFPPSEMPTSIGPGLITKAGLMMRIYQWEESGVAVAASVGLPSSHDILEDIRLRPRLEDQLYPPQKLMDSFFDFWRCDLAWPVLKGPVTDFIVHWSDCDQLLNALAQFLLELGGDSDNTDSATLELGGSNAGNMGHTL